MGMSMSVGHDLPLVFGSLVDSGGRGISHVVKMRKVIYNIMSLSLLLYCHCHCHCYYHTTKTPLTKTTIKQTNKQNKQSNKHKQSIAIWDISSRQGISGHLRASRGI